MLRFNSVQVDDRDRPVGKMPRIIATNVRLSSCYYFYKYYINIIVQVLWNPFDDIVPRFAPVPDKKDDKPKAEKKGTKSDTSIIIHKFTFHFSIRNFSLLSFGDEAEEEEGSFVMAPKVKLSSAPPAPGSSLSLLNLIMGLISFVAKKGKVSVGGIDEEEAEAAPKEDQRPAEVSSKLSSAFFPFSILLK